MFKAERIKEKLLNEHKDKNGHKSTIFELGRKKDS